MEKSKNISESKIKESVLISLSKLKEANEQLRDIRELTSPKIELIADCRDSYLIKIFSRFLELEKNTLKIKQNIRPIDSYSRIDRIVFLNDHIEKPLDHNSQANRLLGKQSMIPRFLVFGKYSTYHEEMSYCEGNPNRRVFSLASCFDKKKSFLIEKRPDIGIFSEAVQQRRVAICFKTRKVLARLPLINVNNRINLSIDQFFFKIFNLIENNEDLLFHDWDYKKHQVRAFRGDFLNFGNHDKKWYNRFQGIICNNLRLDNEQMLSYFGLQNNEDRLLVKTINCFYLRGRDIIGLIALKGGSEEEESCKKVAFLFERSDDFGRVKSVFLDKMEDLDIKHSRCAEFTHQGRFLRLDMGHRPGILKAKYRFVFYYISPNFKFIEIGPLPFENPRLMGYSNGCLVFQGLDVRKENYLKICVDFPFPQFTTRTGHLI